MNQTQTHTMEQTTFILWSKLHLNYEANYTHTIEKTTTVNHAMKQTSSKLRRTVKKIVLPTTRTPSLLKEN